MTHMELVLKFQARRQIVKAIYICIRIINLQVQIRKYMFNTDNNNITLGSNSPFYHISE